MLRWTSPPSATYRVEKTGLPFYDANRLIGAMHAFFGTATSAVCDRGAFYEISGPKLELEVDQIKRVVERTKQWRLGQAVKVGQGLSAAYSYSNEMAEELHNYFGGIRRGYKKGELESVGMILEPAYQQGTRGAEAMAYKDIASMRGEQLLVAPTEVAIASLGATFAAVASGRGEDRLLLMPVLDLESGRPTALGPFIEFDRSYSHIAGGSVAAVASSIGILDAIGSRVRIADIAYARFSGFGFYQSGLLGLHRLCRSWSHLPALLGEAADYFRLTRFESRALDTGTQLRLNEVARTLALFLTNPNLKHLEAITRVKVRLVEASQRLERPTPVAGLFAKDEAIKEAQQMAHAGNFPEPSGTLIRALARVLRFQGAWIGNYVQLERANTPERFFEEVNRILSRALDKANRAQRKGEELEQLKEIETAIAYLSTPDVLEICQPSQRQHWRAYKAVFLLRLTARIARNRRDKPTDGEAGNVEPTTALETQPEDQS